MMKKTLCLFFLLTIYVSAFAQLTEIIPSSVSIANTSVARTDNWSGFGNPASLIQSEGIQAAMQFENKSLLPELSTKLLQAAYNHKLMNVGVAFSHFGYSKYNEMLVGLVLARNFGDKFSLGLQGNFYTSYFSDKIKYQSTFIPQVGMTAHLTPQFTLGFHAFNPFQQNLKTDYIEKRLPSIFSIGTNYYFTENIAWLTQIDKEVSTNFRFATGFEWQLLETFGVKIGGYASEYFVGCFGMGVQFVGLKLDVNCELHPVLGVNMIGKLSYIL